MNLHIECKFGIVNGHFLLVNYRWKQLEMCSCHKFFLRHITLCVKCVFGENSVKVANI